MFLHALSPSPLASFFPCSLQLAKWKTAEEVAALIRSLHVTEQPNQVGLSLALPSFPPSLSYRLHHPLVSLPPPLPLADHCDAKGHARPPRGSSPRFPQGPSLPFFLPPSLPPSLPSSLFPSLPHCSSLSS